MADKKHYSTADYEERARKLKRMLEYRDLLKSLGVYEANIKNEALPDREPSVLEILARQPSVKNINPDDKGAMPGALVDYGPERGLHQGHEWGKEGQVKFDSYEYLKEQYKDLYRYQPDLYHRPEEYFKNLDMARVQFHPWDESYGPYTDAEYKQKEDMIHMLTSNRSGYDVLVHEQEHRNQFKNPKDAYRTGPRYKGESDESRKNYVDATGRFQESQDKQIKDLDKKRIKYGFNRYTEQTGELEKPAEIRRLQSLQPYREEVPFVHVPDPPLKQGGMTLKPIKKK